MKFVSSWLNDADICSLCGDEMITDPMYEKPYCKSWTYMEGGCPPAPMYIREARLDDEMLRKHGRK